MTREPYWNSKYHTAFTLLENTYPVTHPAALPMVEPAALNDCCSLIGSDCCRAQDVFSKERYTFTLFKWAYRTVAGKVPAPPLLA